MTGIEHSRPGPLTDLTRVDPAALTGVPADPAGICALAHTLIIQPDDARKLDPAVPEPRFAENQLRRADLILDALLRLDGHPVHQPRPPALRVIGTCRHFAVLTCALLRLRGIPARTRCGFGTYFQPGLGLDHWVVEHHTDGRWVRTDPEIIGAGVVDRPEDLAEGLFLTGAEAWAAWRAGRIDATRFGVPGTDNFGPAEIMGNAVRDLAALNRVEMLPWDEWGRMTAAYRGETGADYEHLMDRIAEATTTDDPQRVAALYAEEDLRVPADLIR